MDSGAHRSVSSGKCSGLGWGWRACEPILSGIRERVGRYIVCLITREDICVMCPRHTSTLAITSQRARSSRRPFLYLPQMACLFFRHSADVALSGPLIRNLGCAKKRTQKRALITVSFLLGADVSQRKTQNFTDTHCN